MAGVFRLGGRRRARRDRVPGTLAPMDRTGRWKHYRTCNLCEAMCGLEIELDGEEIQAIRGDTEDPFSRGHICPKALALEDIHADPDRLRHPLKKTPTGWERIGWDQALDETAETLEKIQHEHGRHAVGMYLGNPNVHNLGSMLVLSSLIKAIRTPNLFTATSVDQLPHHFAARHMFGHYFLLPVPDIDRTDFLLILGANPVASNGSLMTAPGITQRLRDIRSSGGRIVLVDPRRTETAAEVDRHHFIRPGRDVLLLLAMVRTILKEGLTAPGRLADFSTGLDQLEALVGDYAPERVAPLTGIEAGEIERLAREFARAQRAVCYGRMGLSTQAFGGLCQWLVNVLNIITGNFDREGGAMFTRPAFDIVTEDRTREFGRWKSRVRGLPEFGGELPSAALAEEILNPGEGQIRAMVTVAGNPVLSTPNGEQLDRAFENLDFAVAIDIYLNETTRHADIILPPTTGLECDHYDVVFHVLAIQNTVKFSPALFAPSDDARHDWQIYRELAKRLAPAEHPFDENSPVNQATPAQLVDFGLRAGPYGRNGLSLEVLAEAPHGIDLGPLESCLPERLFTEDGTIHLAPQALVDDLGRVDELFGHAGATGFDLALIGRRHLRSNNSWMHNSARLVKGPELCTVMIHSDDASRLGIETGQTVEVASRVGRIELEAVVNDAIMPGVVSVPHGWGHGREGVALSRASQHAGASVNDLTDETVLDGLTGNAVLNGVPVRVSPISGPAN